MQDPPIIQNLADVVALARHPNSRPFPAFQDDLGSPGGDLCLTGMLIMKASMLAVALATVVAWSGTALAGTSSQTTSSGASRIYPTPQTSAPAGSPNAAANSQSAQSLGGRSGSRGTGVTSGATTGNAMPNSGRNNTKSDAVGTSD
jgi:hypothetical protein